MLPRAVKIVEVGPRDGLQNETVMVPVDLRVKLIDKLSETGLRTIEVGSFVSPKWVPQMDQTAQVLKGIEKRTRVSYPVLVPNIQGYKAAVAAGVDEVAVFAAASEGFSKKNINCSIEDSLARYREICAMAMLEGIQVRGYVSCVQGCPVEGDVSLDRVAYVSKSLYDMGCYEISLGDTIGVGTINGVQTMVRKVSEDVPIDHIAVHFHDTYGQALVNIYAALQLGVHIVDSSILGLGGCPYAQGATGNVATEDVLFMLDGLNIETGIDMRKLIEVGVFICDNMNVQGHSRVAMASR